VNEHHFGNGWTAVDSHNNPNQHECMAAIATSCVIWLLRREKGNCSTLLGKHYHRRGRREGSTKFISI
jgi:hypothetical protein